MASSDAPSPYARNVYDETYRAKSYPKPSIISMGSFPHLLSQLEHHSPQTDGSFGICIAHSSGVFISKDLLDSIPAKHRPAINTTLSGQSIKLVAGGPVKSIGTTFFPFILSDAQTGERLRIVLHAIVVPRMVVSMFIGQAVDFLDSQLWGPEEVMFVFDFGQGGRRNVTSEECRRCGICDLGLQTGRVPLDDVLARCRIESQPAVIQGRCPDI